jgi:hypothetical protein
MLRSHQASLFITGEGAPFVLFVSHKSYFVTPGIMNFDKTGESPTLAKDLMKRIKGRGWSAGHF